MAVDKKSDHYTSAENYRGLDGNMRSFTFVDHDPKTKIGAKPISDQEFAKARQEVVEYRNKLITRILELPASMLPVSVNDKFKVFINRTESAIVWNEAALKDQSIGFELLQAIKHFTEAKMQEQGITG